MQILMPNSVLFGRFKVESWEVSAGQCFGYRGIDINAPINRPWERNVFIKQYHDIVPSSSETDGLARHFHALQTRLSHKSNYISLPLQFGMEANSVIAIYPWVQGVTLKDHIDHGLSEEDSIRIIFALIKVVHYIHQCNVAHLDLKPANVVVERSRKDHSLYLRLVDFDAARIDNTGVRNVVIGTNEYMSPEHCYPARFGSVSTKSDIFTLGIMIYELLFKRHPFDGCDDYARAIAEEAFSIPQQSNYHYDVVYSTLNCMSADPNRRPHAGSLLRIFNSYHQDYLEAQLPNDRWRRAQPSPDPPTATPRPPSTPRPVSTTPMYIQIDELGSDPPFRRIYFATTDLDAQQLRGASVGKVSGPVIRLTIAPAGCSLQLLSDLVAVSIQGRRIRKGEVINLLPNQRLQIGSAVFSLTWSTY